MKANVILEAYTNTIAEYIAKGYVILADQYSSSGTKCHVELTNGEEIVRVEITDKWDYVTGEIITLQVRNTKPKNNPITLNNWYSTRFDDKQEPRVIHTWYDIAHHTGKEWFIDDLDELKKVKELRQRRFITNSRRDYGCEVHITDMKKLKVAWKYLKKQRGFKTCHLEDISYMCKNINNGTYYVMAKGKRMAVSHK